MKSSHESPRKASEFLDSVRRGLLLGAAVVAVMLPPQGVYPRGAPRAVARAAPEPARRTADFGHTAPTEDVRRVANWAVHSNDHQKMAFIIVDKKAARVYVFDRSGRLKGEAPVLLGSAVGDDTVPGIGKKPIRLVRPEERTTPAGRFIAELGTSSTRGEDVVWVDYAAAVSMHRVITTNRAERRLERLASPDPAEHRISYGCINLPRAFYENVVSPAVRHGGAVIYVLPETRSAEQVFGPFDRPAVKLAQR
jgi:hypothetical protein